LQKRVTYCVNIIENEKRRISKIGKEVQELFELEKNTVLSEKVLNKLKNITNLNNCECPQEKYSDSENQIEETINDINMPESLEPKEIFSSFAQPYSKELDELFSRASIICEEEKNGENFGEKNVEKDQKNFEENFAGKSNEKTKDFEEKTKDFDEKSNEIENEKTKENEKTNENTKEKSNVSFEENKITDIQPIIPLNISKSLEEILFFLKENCEIKYVNFLYKTQFIN